MVDLKSGVIEIVLSPEHLFELAAYGMAVGWRLDQHMCRKRGESTRYQPDVDIVYRLDRRVRDDVAGYRLGVVAGRRRFQEHSAGLPKQSPCRADHEQHDEK